jgi:murein L,D-transpeptidase YcbB/YkuD
MTIDSNPSRNQSPIESLTAAVRKRLRLASMVDGLTSGLMIGAAAALLFAVSRLILAPTTHWGWAFAIAAAGGIIGLIVGAARSRTDQAAARLIDQHYNLKDRSITTLEFLSPADDEARKSHPAMRLQIEEAEKHLKSVDATKCVPIEPWNRPLRWAAGLAAGMLVVLALTNGGVSEVKAKQVLSLATEQSTTLRETMLAELEELAKEHDDPEIEKLLEELREKVDEMESDSLDESDLMATLSEMEQSLAEARDAMQLEMTDAAMQSLAAAIKPSDQLQQAAKAMESKDYEKAAEELASVDPSKIGDKQRRAVADNLKKMVAKLAQGKSGQLSESISQLAESLDSKNMKECKACLSKLAGQCKKQGQCKKIGQCMSSQLNRLSECKGQCRGQCQSKIARKSNSPSTKAGIASSGQPLGDKATQIDSSRKEQQLTGMQGEGPSETEIMQAPEGEQDAARAYAGKYDEFRREAEAVLNSEPLPMGVRETVRTYFESIRPNNATDEVAASQGEAE